MNDWLVMLFLGGDNDLFKFGQNLLDEATSVGSSDRVMVVAELDPTIPEKKSLRGPLFPGRRAMKEIGVTGGDPAEIIDFVDECKQLYPARHRALILWDHGDGWKNVHIFKNVVKAIEIVKDQHPAGPHAIEHNMAPAKEKLFIKGLRSVLDQTRDISIVGFDACLMSMIEIAFQLRDTAQFMVASQNSVPAPRGWAYEALLRTLTLRPQMDPEDLVRAMVDTFAGSYNGASDAVTLSALRLSAEVDSTVAAIDAFSRALLAAVAASDAKNGSVRDLIVLARRHTQSFANPEYIDLVSFCDQVRKFIPDEARVARTADLVKNAVSKLVVRHTRSGSASISESNGVSIYFPELFDKAAIAESYKELDFADEDICRWRTFLEVIVEGTDAPALHLMMKSAPEIALFPRACAENCACQRDIVDDSGRAVMPGA